ARTGHRARASAPTPTGALAPADAQARASAPTPTGALAPADAQARASAPTPTGALAPADAQARASAPTRTGALVRASAQAGAGPQAPADPATGAREAAEQPDHRGRPSTSRPRRATWTVRAPRTPPSG